MTIHQKYFRYLMLTTAVTLAAAYGIAATSIEGIGLAVLFLVAAISGYLTLAIFVSLLAKNPTKTFHRFVDIFDLLLLWPWSVTSASIVVKYVR